jgi:hypothetical protein
MLEALELEHPENEHPRAPSQPRFPRVVPKKGPVGRSKRVAAMYQKKESGHYMTSPLSSFLPLPTVTVISSSHGAAQMVEDGKGLRLITTGPWTSGPS